MTRKSKKMLRRFLTSCVSLVLNPIPQIAQPTLCVQFVVIDECHYTYYCWPIIRRLICGEEVARKQPFLLLLSIDHHHRLLLLAPLLMLGYFCCRPNLNSLIVSGEKEVTFYRNRFLIDLASCRGPCHNIVLVW